MVIKFIETKSSMGIVSILQVEKCSGKIGCMYLRLLNCVLKNGQDSKFCVRHI